MYGKNEVFGVDHRADGTLRVNSMFYTLQGEGPDAGRPAIFLRLSRCNLRCWFCDTEFSSGVDREVVELADEIKAQAKEHGCTLVVITGGEPLLQNIIPLVKLLNQAKIGCSVETAGTVWLDGIEELFASFRDWKGNLIVCSPKTPKLNERLVGYIGALKYIVRKGEVAEDGLPTMSTQLPGEASLIYRAPPIIKGTIPIYLQPCDEGDDEINAVNERLAAELCMTHGYRLSIQLHKIVGLP
jgi:organic radical activating enzyme